MILQLTFWALMSTALAAGAVAAFNPCGFAMLPAYLSFFLGLDSDEEQSTSYNVLRGLGVAATLTMGFVLVFGLAGILTTTVISQGTIFEYIPWVTLTFAILLIPLGIAMIRGYEPKLNLPRLQKGGKTRDLPSMFMFGVSYAVVSLSCTAPIFIGTVIGSFTRADSGFLEGLGSFVAYALGMGLVITVLTLAMAFARQGVASTFRKALPWVNKISGVFLVFTGIFLIFYARWEISTFSEDGPSDNALTDLALDFQGRVTNALNTFGVQRAVAIAGVIVVALVGWALWSRRTKTIEATQMAEDSSDSVEPERVPSI